MDYAWENIPVLVLGSLFGFLGVDGDSFPSIIIGALFVLYFISEIM